MRACHSFFPRFSAITRYVLIAAMTMTRPTTAQTRFTIESTEVSLLMLTVLLTACALLGTVIFHWVLAPLVEWIAERLA